MTEEGQAGKNKEMKKTSSSIVSDAFVERARVFVETERASFVSEGTVTLMELGHHGVSPNIPPGESAITSLVKGMDGRVYGLTSGRRCHFFLYDSSPSSTYVIDIDIVGVGDGLLKNCLVVSKKGFIFGAGRKVGTSDRVCGRLFCYDPRGYIGNEEFYRVNKVEWLVTSPEDEDICVLTIDSKRDIIYGLTRQSHIFFSYDIEREKLQTISRVEGERPSHILVSDIKGNVYGFESFGKMFKFDVEKGEVTPTSLQVPCGKGKEYVNEATAAVLDQFSGVIYGGTMDGYLFSFDPDSEELISLGRPIDQPNIRCLTIGNDGMIFGIAGERHRGMAHLFRYNPQKGDLRDLGVLKAFVPFYWVGYDFESATTGRNGEIILGESDRTSHLFIYYPPIRPRPHY